METFDGDLPCPSCGRMTTVLSERGLMVHANRPRDRNCSTWIRRSWAAALPVSDPEAVAAWLWKDLAPRPRTPAPTLPVGELVFGDDQLEPLVPPDATAYYELLSPFTFRPDIIAIAEDVAPFFELVAIRIGTHMQEDDNARPLPCSACCPEVVPIALELVDTHIKVHDARAEDDLRRAAPLSMRAARAPHVP